MFGLFQRKKSPDHCVKRGEEEQTATTLYTILRMYCAILFAHVLVKLVKHLTCRCLIFDERYKHTGDGVV